MPKATTAKTIGLRSSAVRTLKFGLVAVKVATGPSMDDSARVSAKMLDPVSLTPLKQLYQNADGEVVERTNIVKGYEYDGGYTVLEHHEKPAELDGDGSIELTATVAHVPHEYITGTALVWPADNGSDEAYMLVAQYLAATGRAFIGTTVASGTTKVVAIRWSGIYECIVSQTLVYASQIRWNNIQVVRDGLDTLPSPEPSYAAMAAKLFGELPDSFDYSAVRDEYGERMLEAIKAKAEGTEVPDPVVLKGDPLMDALKESLAPLARNGAEPLKIKELV